jgi:DNA polymerase nu
MEAIGIQVNTDKLLHFAELLKLKIAQVETCAHKVAKRTFSINSTLQLRQVLFDELQLDKKCSKKLSKTHVLKHKSTSEAVLIQLQDLHPLPGLVLEYRQLCKIKATYITGILPYISEGVLHPCWQHTGAATGRLVSCSPNIQAFPKQAIDLGAVNKQFIVGKEEERQSVEVREAVVSRVGHSFVATDFRSIELRLLAHLSGDPALISILTTQPQSTSPDVFMHLAAQWSAS